jgi:hypothetical protein
MLRRLTPSCKTWSRRGFVTAQCQTIRVASGTEGNQQSLFRLVAGCQVYWLALAADEQDFGAVGLKDHLGVFIQV